MSIFAFQIIKIFSEDGFGKMVEIPADMTARDLCQLLVYKNHCVDDNSWALVEHHPALGLGNWLASFLGYGGVCGFIVCPCVRYFGCCNYSLCAGVEINDDHVKKDDRLS